MKYLSFILSILLLFSCAQESDKMPTDLAGMQKLLTEKKNEFKKLEKEIESLQSEVDKKSPPKKAQAYEVYTHRVEKQDFKSYVKLQGYVTTDENVSASSETGGRITSLLVSEGEYVSRGQGIAVIDVSTQEKQLEEIETSYELATTVFERQKRLWEQQIGSELQFLEAKTNKERLEKSMATLKNQLAKKNVSAPISGYVDRVIMKQGELAGPGVPIVQILNAAQVKVVADIPESYLSNLKKGNQIDIAFPAIEKEIKRPISMIGRSIDPANRTFKIEMKASNKGGELKPNLLAELTIPEKKIKDAVVLPINLIRQEVTGSKYVFVINETGKEKKVNKVFVKTGDSYENLTVITEGLIGGELIVESGGESLNEGSEIKILERNSDN